MRLHRTSTLWSGAAVLCLLAVVAMADEVQEALDGLMAASPQEQRTATDKVVALSDAAVAPLTAEVAQFRQAEDKSYIGLCVVALGELKSESPTDDLVKVLLGTDQRLSYLAAQALGSIWEGKGPGEPKAKLVNAALMGAIYARAVSTYTMGPSLAFVKVNSIPLPRTVGGRRVLTFKGLDPQEIITIAEGWLTANPGALADVDQQPWGLNLHMALAGTDAAARSSAIQALRRKRELAPVELLLAALAAEDETSSDLADLLGDLTGIPFPPVTADAATLTAQELADYWKRQWLADLSGRTDQKRLDYALSELENALLGLHDNPSDAVAAKVSDYRMVVLRQFPDADAIPGGASAGVKDLLDEPLEIKQEIDAALGDLEGGKLRDYKKRTLLQLIEQKTKDELGREVGLLFLGRLAEIARTEPTQGVASKIGEVLSHISGIPCQLNSNRPETRLARLEQWILNAQGAGLYVEGV